MKFSKKILRIGALLLSLWMLATVLIACSKKEVRPFVYPERELVSRETFSFGDYGYQKYTDGTAILVSYTGKEPVLTLPDTMEGCPLVELRAGVFSYHKELTSIVLNNSLEIIGSYAFVGCSALESITFGSKLWSVGTEALTDTPWLAAQKDEFLIVGDGVLIKYQGDAVSVNVPDTVRHICSAFVENQKIKSVFLPETVVTVGNCAFSSCLSLVYVSLSPNIVLIDQYAFYSCNNLALSELPSGVVRIGQFAFYDNYALQALRCGDSLKAIDSSAFSNCGNLKTMEIPATLETIDYNAFEDCVSLSVVYYGGTKQQMESIRYLTEENSNTYFKDATKFYKEESK